MSFFGCNSCCRPGCTGVAVIAAAVVGVLTAFLQISGVVAFSAVLVGGFLGIAVVYLAVLTVAAALARNAQGCCGNLGAALAGILGTVAAAVVLLVVDIAAASVLGALLTGVLLFFFTLALAATACYARCLCQREA